MQGGRSYLRNETTKRRTMKMRTRRETKYLTILFVSLLVFGAAFEVQALTPVRLRLASGSPGGTWDVISAGISEIERRQNPGSDVTVIPGSGMGNPLTVSTGKAEVGIAFATFVAAAYKGSPPYKEKPQKNLRALAYLNVLQDFHIMARKDLPVNSIKEIVEKKYPLKFSTAQRGSSHEIFFKRILAEYGVGYDDIIKWGGKIQYVSLSDAVNLFRDGNIDMVLQGTSIGSSTPMELMATGKVKLLPIQEKVRKALLEKYGLISSLIPAGSYPDQTEDINTSGDSPVLFASAALSEDMVYAFTKVLCENTDYLQKAFKGLSTFIPEKYAATNYGVPLHPGAEKYYRERGWIK
jgi:TRAP transporter TAXI family solute receptor